MNLPNDDLRDALDAVRGRPPVPPAGEPVILMGSRRRWWQRGDVGVWTLVVTVAILVATIVSVVVAIVVAP